MVHDKPRMVLNRVSAYPYSDYVMPKNSMCSTLLIAAAAFVAMPLAHGALTISNDSIVSSHYIYSLNFADLQNATKFDNDIFSKTNVSVFQEGSGTDQRNFIRAEVGKTYAELVYKFDFTTTNYRPTELALSDFILVNTATGTLVGKSEYSVDGSNWATIRTKTSTGKAETSGFGTTSITLSSPDVVYYRVTFSITDATLAINGAQWNRLGSGSGTWFTANFTVTEATPIPEPSTLVLLAGVGVLCLSALYRRFSKTA